jgi:hypothetical protein
MLERKLIFESVGRTAEHRTQRHGGQQRHCVFCSLSLFRAR